MTDLCCAVEDYTVPRNPPMTCGFPATTTTPGPDGEPVGICRTHEAPAVASGHILTRIESAEETR